jgi:hypothetical protein
MAEQGRSLPYHIQKEFDEYLTRKQGTATNNSLPLLDYCVLAIDTAFQWATFNGCDTEPDLSSDDINLDRLLSDDETLVGNLETGCAPGGAIELWAIRGGSHIPILSSDFSRLVIEYFLAHPKPE